MSDSALLPDCWTTLKLGELFASERRGIEPAQYPEQEFELWSVPAFPSGAPEIVRGKEVGSNKQRVSPGDVLLCKINPRINRVWVVGQERGLQQIASTEWIVLRGPSVDPRFLAHQLRESSFRERLCAEVSGVGGSLTRARPQAVAELEVAVAPLDEQRRIAAKLDELLASSRAAQAALDAVPALLERYRQAVLAAAFRSDLDDEFVESLKSPTDVEPDESGLPRIPTAWTWATAAEVVERDAEIVYGIVQPGPDVPGGVPYIRGKDIQDGVILEHQLLRTSPAIAARYERASLRGGDVLLGIIRATKVAVVPASLERANITQGTARFRPSSTIRTGFLAAWLASPYAQRWLHNQYRGIDMPGLNLRDVRRLPVPMAPLTVQEALETRLAEAELRIRAVGEALGHAIQRAVALEASTLRKAFQGALVPQDPADEPASALLARLRAERASTPTPRARRAPARA